jgi:hypothetical protein
VVDLAAANAPRYAVFPFILLRSPLNQGILVLSVKTNQRPTRTIVGAARRP